MNMTWQWQIYFEHPEGSSTTYLQWMLSAWGWTISVSLCSMVVAMLVGTVIGMFRTLPNSPVLSRFGAVWVELFRNIPLLVQIFLWYYVLPAVFPVLKGIPSFLMVVFALGFFTSARIAEQVRSGIQSLPKGQRYAGYALGLSTPQNYRYVLMPMAFRIILPPLTSEMMSIIKNSSIAFAVSIPELTMFAIQASEESTRSLEMYFGVTVLYVITALIVNRVMALIERKASIPGLVTSTKGGH